MNLTSFYTDRKNHFEAIRNELNTRIFWLGWARLLVFLLFGLGIYFFIKNGFQYGWILAVLACFAGFLALVKYNEKLLDRRDVIRHLIRMNENELQVLQHQPSYLKNGEKYHKDESYLLDLDIFGHRSVFHLLNRTATLLGESQLADLLKNPLDKVELVDKQQLAVQELAQKSDFRQYFLAQALRTQDNPPEYERLLAWVESEPEFYYATYVRVARILMPALVLLALVYGIITLNFYLFTSLFIINFFVAGRYGMKVTKIHAAVSKSVESLSVFAELFSLVNKEDFKSAILYQIQQETTEANTELKKLDKLANLFDQRLNMVAYALLTGLFVYDLQCVYWLEAWKIRNRDHLRRWLNAIGEVEMLNSLATFHFNNPDYVFPEVKDDAPFIDSTALAHPLIPAHERVSNDFQMGIKQNLYIVTGSNMSGKSTFLRTVGVNVLLARLGAPVCAARFACTPMAIHTSLRQSDSLQDHVSTFYAELKTLQEILHHLEKNPYALVLLDEVLRGTNSDDKLYGSQQLVRRLIDLGCVGLLATHDIELSKMEQEFPQKLGNLCFESIIENGNLYFDYKLKTGTAQNRNATFLMQKMGIIPNLGTKS